ncbi:hypothetical protein ACK2J6_001176 [Vibrio fluvialis]
MKKLFTLMVLGSATLLAGCATGSGINASCALDGQPGKVESQLTKCSG